jgi:YggT family protein
VNPILLIIGLAAYLMSWLIIARALLSWFPNSRNHPAVVLLYQITDPIILPIQRVVPRMGMIDISPMIAFGVLQIIAYATGVRGL